MSFSTTLKTGLLLALLLTPMACGGASERGQADRAPERPRFEISTQEAFEPDSIDPYLGDHSQVYAHIDENLDRHLANLQRWLRQPSVSAQNIGIAEMAEMVRSDLENLGFEEASVVSTSGHPGVWGYYDAGAEKTLLVYLMYDVQPVNPEDWDSPPFEAALLDRPLGKVVMAREQPIKRGRREPSSTLWSRLSR